MRVFISSTVFDLIDVRAELGSQLIELGITPVLSDDKLSDFQVSHNANSIQTCLVNVESCDEVILILDRRYGPRLGKFGFDDVSATHLEYKKAMDVGKPVHVFARDRLIADYDIWKKNKRKSDVELTWVTEERDRGLFDLLDEHSRLTSGKRSNWLHPFSSSMDLKAAIKKEFNKKILPQRLVNAIHENCFPVFEIQLDNNDLLGRLQEVVLTARITNVGGAPAFDCRIHWLHSPEEVSLDQIVQPNQSISRQAVVVLEASNDDFETQIILSYRSQLGVGVEERFEVGIKYFDGRQLVGAVRIGDRKFHYDSPIEIDIIEDPRLS